MSARRRRQVRPESRPCPRPTHWTIAILRASYQLPHSAKLVLELLRELDNGDGAFLAPAEAAAQLGMSQSHYEEVRAALVRRGLVAQVSVDGSKLDFWFVRLPADFELEPPAGSDRDERCRWVRRWADELDRRLEPGKAGPRWYRTEPGKAGSYLAGPGALSPALPDVEPGFAGSPGQLSPALPNPEPGEAGPSEHETAAFSAPSDSLKAVIQGVIQHEKNGNGTDAIASQGVSQNSGVRHDYRTPLEKRAAFREAAELERRAREQQEAHRIPAADVTP